MSMKTRVLLVKSGERDDSHSRNHTRVVRGGVVHSNR